MTVTQNLQYWLIKGVLSFLSIFPRKLMGMLGTPLGLFWLLVDKRHRDIAGDNLAKAYGRDINDPEIRKMRRANFIQLARSAMELPSLFRMNDRNVDSYVTIENARYLTDEIAKGKGVLALTAHLGNWEMMSLATPLKLGLDVHALVRPLDHAPMGRIITELRTRAGNKLIDKDKSAGTVKDLLAENNIIAILLDQNASWYEGVYVRFFDRVACANKGMAMLALLCDVPVIPLFNFRGKDGRYRVIFEKPLTLHKTGDFEHDVIENTRLFTQVIEKYVRMAPDNWLWVHRRWRIKDIPEEARDKIKGSLE
jgi:Kdo2-lipid IVA lauroyltransferase/acyltransferase